jgi:hypothetical protein
MAPSGHLFMWGLLSVVLLLETCQSPFVEFDRFGILSFDRVCIRETNERKIDSNLPVRVRSDDSGSLRCGLIDR